MNQHYGSFEAEHIIASFPVSTRNLNAQVNEIGLWNELGGVAFKLPVTNEFKIDLVKEEINTWFNPKAVWAGAFFIDGLAFLPLIFIDLLYSLINDRRIDLVFSNLGSNPSHFKFKSQQISKLSLFPPLLPTG